MTIIRKKNTTPLLPINYKNPTDFDIFSRMPNNIALYFLLNHQKSKYLQVKTIAKHKSNQLILMYIDKQNQETPRVRMLLERWIEQNIPKTCRFELSRNFLKNNVANSRWTVLLAHVKPKSIKPLAIAQFNKATHEYILKIVCSRTPKTKHDVIRNLIESSRPMMDLTGDSPQEYTEGRLGSRIGYGSIIVCAALDYMQNIYSSINTVSLMSIPAQRLAYFAMGFRFGNDQVDLQVANNINDKQKHSSLLKFISNNIPHTLDDLFHMTITDINFQLKQRCKSTLGLRW